MLQSSPEAVSEVAMLKRRVAVLEGQMREIKEEMNEEMREWRARKANAALEFELASRSLLGNPALSICLFVC